MSTDRFDTATKAVRRVLDSVEALTDYHDRGKREICETIVRAVLDAGPDDEVLAYAKRQSDRFRATLERIAYHEECADVEAEDMRQSARAVLGWKTLGDRA
jgi:hypothetical protein